MTGHSTIVEFVLLWAVASAAVWLVWWLFVTLVVAPWTMWRDRRQRAREADRRHCEALVRINREAAQAIRTLERQYHAAVTLIRHKGRGNRNG